MQVEPMVVEYQIALSDLFAFQWRAAYKSPLLRRARRRLYAYLFLALFLISLLPAITGAGFRISQMNFPFLLVSVPVVGLLTWLLDKRLTRRAIKDLLKAEKEDRGQLGRHEVHLSEEGLREITNVGETRTSWSGIDRVEQDEQYIFIYTTPHAAHVIPKRAFTGSVDADDFYEFARARTGAAR